MPKVRLHWLPQSPFQSRVSCLCIFDPQSQLLTGIIELFANNSSHLLFPVFAHDIRSIGRVLVAIFPLLHDHRPFCPPCSSFPLLYLHFSANHRFLLFHNFNHMCDPSWTWLTVRIIRVSFCAHISGVVIPVTGFYPLISTILPVGMLIPEFHGPPMVLASGTGHFIITHDVSSVLTLSCG